MKVHLIQNPILFIDDERIIREEMQVILQRNGYVVKTAETANQALDILESGTIEPLMIITDERMPGLSGFEFCALLKNDERYRSIPLMFLTARYLETEAMIGLNLGATDYLTKPFEPSEVLEKIAFHYQSRVEQLYREHHLQVDEVEIETDEDIYQQIEQFRQKSSLCENYQQLSTEFHLTLHKLFDIRGTLFFDMAEKQEKTARDPNQNHYTQIIRKTQEERKKIHYNKQNTIVNGDKVSYVARIHPENPEKRETVAKSIEHLLEAFNPVMELSTI